MKSVFDNRGLLPEIWAYEMYYDKEICDVPDIHCVPFSKENFEEYKIIYNECFYPMRKCLDIKPYDWYSDYSQIVARASNIFLLIDDNCIVGSVACYGNEIDDLIVKPSEQNKGYGKKLLLWAMHHIRNGGNCEIVLHVAEWNKTALTLYRQVGFVVRKKEKVR